jgi:multiple antibiotic resistance protein
MSMILEYISALVLLIVIIDPLVSMAAFMALTDRMKRKEKIKIAIKAVIVAAIPLFTFIFFGNVLLEILRVNIDTFKAAGGLILILLGIQLSTGTRLPKKGKKQDHSATASIIGTPLITGPATIATGIILTNDFGVITTAAAGLSALTIVWILLMLGSVMHKYLGNTGIRVISTMLGLITIASGLKFIKEGLLI